MSSETDLYRKPEDVLRRELDHLKERLKEERGEIARYEALRAKNEELAGLVTAAKKDAARTTLLLTDYRKALRSIGVKP